jgi:hypothetical protein
MLELTSLLEDIGLYRAAAHALDVEELSVFRRLQRTAEWEGGDTCILKFWYSEIRPPAAPPACLTHVQLTSAKDRGELRGAKTVFCVPNDQWIVVQGPKYHEPNWIDPVAAKLANLDLWAGGGEIPFGGFSYKLLVCTARLQAVIEFGRMTHPSHREIASAMFEIAASLGSEHHSAVDAFLDLWLRELRLLGM